MKRNLNVLISISLGTLYAGGIGYLIFKIMDKVDINLIFIGLAIVFIISIIVLYSILEKLIRQQFEVLE